MAMRLNRLRHLMRFAQAPEWFEMRWRGLTQLRDWLESRGLMEWREAGVWRHEYRITARGKEAMAASVAYYERRPNGFGTAPR